jgi:hypothetical protein
MAFSTGRAKRSSRAAAKPRLCVDRLEDRVNPAPVVFSGVGTADANAQFAAFKTAMGGVDNGDSVPQTNGFRTINWDDVSLTATDGSFTNTVITANHTVAVPLNRYQQRGTVLNDTLPVTDTGFTTENPGLQPPQQFAPFSGDKVVGMYNQNFFDLHFVVPSAAPLFPTAAGTRGFGAIFLDVDHDNSAAIEFYHGSTRLGMYSVPAGPSGEPVFLGVLFDNPVVTSVSIGSGEAALFNFDGTTVTSGPPDTTVSGTVDQVALDDFAFAEPVASTGTLIAGQATKGTTINVYSSNGNGSSRTLVTTFDAYPGFKGGVSIATADVNGDGVLDVITGAGPGGGPHVKVFDGAALLKGQVALLQSYFAYGVGFTGGVSVAVGDVNADGTPDVITGPGAGGGPHVKVFSGKDGSTLASFFAYAPSFPGGVNVAAADFTNDGHDDIVTGAGPGGGPHVKVVDGTKLGMLQSDGQIAASATLASFFAYAATYTGGVSVSAGEVNGTGAPDVVTGALRGQAQVKAFDGTALLAGTVNAFATFLAYDAAFTGGVRVGVADLNGDGRDEIITGAGAGGGPHVKVFDGSNLNQLIDSFFAFDPTFTGGVTLAAGL